jgi:hypothetical protein
MGAHTEIDLLSRFYEGVFENALTRVLDECNALFPTVDAELAGQIARINVKPNIMV